MNNITGLLMSNSVAIQMTEGKGFQGRRQERKQEKQLAEFIKNQDKIIAIPDKPTKPTRKRFSS